MDDDRREQEIKESIHKLADLNQGAAIAYALLKCAEALDRIADIMKEKKDDD